MNRARQNRSIVLASAALALLPRILFADNTTPPIDGGNNPPGPATPVGAEPAVHHSFVRDDSHGLAATDVDYAQFLAGATNGNLTVQYGSIDTVMAQCFGGGFQNDIAAQKFTYSFSSASGYDEPAWNIDTVGPASNINFNGSVNNFTRAYNDAASSPSVNANAQATMLNIFNAANQGIAVPDPTTNAPVAVAKDPFSVPTLLASGSQERPQYSSSGAASDNRTMVNDPKGSREFAILVAWDVADPRHAMNIDLMYNTLINVDKVPADQIEVLFPENSPFVNKVQNGTDTNFFLPNAFPNAPGNVNTPVPINADNTGSNFQEALEGGYFGTADKPTANDKLFIYNTGHGGQTSLIDQGTVGDFHTEPTKPNPGPGVASDVRYLIPAAHSSGGGGFGVPGAPTVQNPMSQGDPEYSSIGGIPSNLPGGPADPNAGDIGKDRMELIFKPGTKILNLGNLGTNVQVQLNGTALAALPAPSDPQFNCDDILTGGKYVYCTVDFQSSEFVPNMTLDPDNIAIDLLNLDPTQQTSNILYAVDLIGGDQEALFVVVPEPATTGLMALAAIGFLSRRQRS